MRTAVGQPRLMALYGDFFREHQIVTAQALLTRYDFGNRERFLSIRQVLEGLLARDVLPIINENDVVAGAALSFGDNNYLAAAVAAIVGHMFPAWLGFRGGRGVATAIGAFPVIGWLAVVADLVLWLIAAAVWRYASLSSILWAVALPLMFYWLYAPGHHPPPDVTVGVVAAAVLILWRHRPNLRRLIEGTESRLSFRR